MSLSGRTTHSRVLREGNRKSTGSTLGGVKWRVGGVDVSEGPDDPAVEGRASTEGDCEGRASRRVLRFRVLAMSGHTHCGTQLNKLSNTR